MTGSERHTHVRTAWDEQTRRQRIGDLNNRPRHYQGAGQIFMTPGIQDMGADGLVRVIRAVHDYDAFTSDNDPYDEHDFGSVDVDDQRVFWKIDYYDRDRRFGSPDPSDPAVTTRVLTIMLASEYRAWQAIRPCKQPTQQRRPVQVTRRQTFCPSSGLSRFSKDRWMACAGYTPASTACGYCSIGRRR